MTDVEDDDESYEPPWPGWRAMVSGRAGIVALVVVIVGGVVSSCLALAQQTANSPSHTRVVCLPLNSLIGGSGVPANGPTQICVTEHS